MDSRQRARSSGGHHSWGPAAEESRKHDAKLEKLEAAREFLARLEADIEEWEAGLDRVRIGEEVRFAQVQRRLANQKTNLEMQKKAIFEEEEKASREMEDRILALEKQVMKEKMSRSEKIRKLKRRTLGMYEQIRETLEQIVVLREITSDHLFATNLEEDEAGRALEDETAALEKLVAKKKRGLSEKIDNAERKMRDFAKQLHVQLTPEQNEDLSERLKAALEQTKDHALQRQTHDEDFPQIRTEVAENGASLARKDAALSLSRANADRASSPGLPPKADRASSPGLPPVASVPSISASSAPVQQADRYEAGGAAAAFISLIQALIGGFAFE